MINFFSIILGLVAWGISLVSLLGWLKKQKSTKWVRFSMISFSACAIAICLQIFYINFLVNNGELASVADTVGTVAVVSAILVSVTILLNIITFILYRGKLTI